MIKLIHTDGTRITDTEFLALYPNLSFPTPIPFGDYGYSVIAPAPVPTHDPVTQTVQEIDPIDDTNHWIQQWQVVALDAATVAANQAAAVQTLQANIVTATQARLDTFAQTRGYDGIKSACSYAGCSVTKFASEGAYCRDKMAETYAALYTGLAEVQAGTRPMPTSFADVEPLLPALAWPA